MQWQRRGEVPRIDLSLALRLVPAALGLWQRLTFDPAGRLVHGITGRPIETIRLQAGRHGHRGATYLIDLGPLAPQAQARARQEEQSRRRPGQPVAPPPGRVRWTLLRGQGEHRVHGRLEDERQRWAVDIDLRATDNPSFQAHGSASLTDLMARDDRTRFWLNRVAGKGHGRATVDLTPLLATGGQVVSADGSMHAAKARASVEVATAATTWTVDLGGTLTGRRLGRLVLLVAGGRIRAKVDSALDERLAAAATDVASLERELHALSNDVAAAGAEQAYVERGLWRALDRW